jgi:hypothetical protein
MIEPGEVISKEVRMANVRQYFGPALRAHSGEVASAPPSLMSRAARSGESTLAQPGVFPAVWL